MGGPIVTVRQFIIGVGAVFLLAGVIGLLAPVSVSNDNGGSIRCGNAVATDLSGARNASNNNVANIPILNQILPHKDYVAQCQSSVNGRRWWTIPLAIVGIIAIAGGVLVRRTGAPAGNPDLDHPHPGGAA
jgi:hypothetical protein